MIDPASLPPGSSPPAAQPSPAHSASAADACAWVNPPFLSVGLTGGIGSGKTVVSDRLAALGAHVIDSDLLARQLTVAGGAAIEPIRTTFGADFIDETGALDRGRMRAAVFADTDARKALEGITHPLIQTAIRADIEAARTAGQPPPYLVFAVPLLVETGAVPRYDRILVVDCDTSTQIARVISRSGLKREQVAAIIATQASRDARRAVANDILVNQDLPLDALYGKIDALHAQYLAIARCGAGSRALE